MPTVAFCMLAIFVAQLVAGSRAVLTGPGRMLSPICSEVDVTERWRPARAESGPLFTGPLEVKGQLLRVKSC